MPMNRVHRWLCRSEGWRKKAGARISWVLSDTRLGQNLLELGPGPGLTTDMLRLSTRRMTAVEIDPEMARSLAARLAGGNVEVVTGDAAALPFPDGLFSAVVSFTMLHHIPSIAMQDHVLREVRRVLEPGGFFAGADSRQSLRMRLIHIGDTLVPVDPDGFAARLTAAGFSDAFVETNATAFRFRARRPLNAAATRAASTHASS